MKKIFKWAVITLMALLAVAAVYYLKKQGVNAEVTTVYKGEIKQYLEETAEVLSREKQTVYIEGSGKIIDMMVKEGDTVMKGDLLLSLDKTDLELQLRDAEAKIQSAMAQLKGTDLENYANKIEQVKVAVEQAQISYDSALRNFESAKMLNESKAISKEELARSQDAYKTAVAALESANLQLADAKKGAPEHIRNSYRAQLEQAYVAKDAILRNIQKQELRAPINGVVMEKTVEINSPAAPNTPALIIGNLDNLELEASILADDVGKIKIGNEVEVSGKPIGDAVFRGKLVKIAPIAKTVVSSLGLNQKRVPVTIELTDKSAAIKPGYKLDIKIITDVRKEVTLVPDTAVFEYKDKDTVFVVKNGKAVLMPVKKGIESEDRIEIQEGLKEGDVVLVKPDNNIEEGIDIKPVDKGGKGSEKSVQ